MAGPKENPQRSFEEEELTDPDLVKKVEEWIGAKEKAKAPKKAERVAGESAKEAIRLLELEPGLYRVGANTIELKEQEGGKKVEFERSASVRITPRRAAT